MWLILGMRVFVISEMVLSSESLATHITWEGPLICVGPLMDHHIVGLGELAMTELADEPLLWSRGSGLGLVRMVRVTRVTLTMAGVLEAGVKVVVTKPLLEQEGLAHLCQAGRKAREWRNVEGGQ